MKKLIGVCLAVLVISALFVTAAATGTERAVLASSERVQQGKTVAVSVTLSDCGVVNGYTVELMYDKTVFELAGATWQPQDLPFGTEADAGTFLLETPQVPGKSPILTFTLLAKAEVAVGTVSEVSCAVTLLTDAGEISAAVQPVTVQITCPHEFKKNLTSEYLKTPATCTEPAEYYKSCSLCGAIDESQTFLSGTALSHNFKDREAAQYLAEPGDCQNRDIYYVSCVACGLQGEQTFEGRTLGEHVYDSDCDAKCNVCFDEREVVHQAAKEWLSNEKGHWHGCVLCEEKVGYTKHTPGPEPTPDEPQTCTECGYVIRVHEDHTHTYGQTWSADGTSHWQECACGEKTEPEAHSWDANGTCSTCGTADAAQSQPTEPTVPVQSAGQDRTIRTATLVLGILLLLSLTGNVVLICLRMKKK